MLCPRGRGGGGVGGRGGSEGEEGGGEFGLRFRMEPPWEKCGWDGPKRGASDVPRH